MITFDTGYTRQVSTKTHSSATDLITAHHSLLCVSVRFWEWMCASKFCICKEYWSTAASYLISYLIEGLRFNTLDFSVNVRLLISCFQLDERWWKWFSTVVQQDKVGGHSCAYLLVTVMYICLSLFAVCFWHLCHRLLEYFPVLSVRYAKSKHSVCEP